MTQKLAESHLKIVRGNAEHKVTHLKNVKSKAMYTVETDENETMTRSNSNTGALVVVAGVAVVVGLAAFFWLRSRNKDGDKVLETLVDFCENATTKLESRQAS